MKKFLSRIKLKFIILILIVITILTVAFHFNFFELKTKLYNKYPNLALSKYIFKNIILTNNLNNDYNVKFLPYTQFVKMKLTKKKLIFKKEYYSKLQQSDPSISYSQWGTFFIETYKKKLLISDFLGNIYYYDNLNNIIDNPIKELKLNIIKTNLKVYRVFDIFFHDEKIYIAYITEENNCRKINISVAKFNQDSLIFNKLFSPKECNETGAIGRMQFYNHQGKPGILFSTAEGTHDKPGKNAQNDKSVFGKTLFLDLNNQNYFIFSKGHRVSQGLYTEGNLILSSEHGPRGGDEINKIILNGNYGWPISSYGERYDFTYQKNPYYQKKHENLNFEEPIFAFVPSIGISEILKLPNKFSNFFHNDLMITSLNDRSVYIANFDEDFSRIITIEKIFLGERIRDIKYYEELNSILLAFEENGEIGILSVIK